MSERPIVVLGAGPAGMSAAWQLAKEGRRVLVLEKNGFVGGLGATTSVNGFRLDFGPHILCLRETAESQAMLEELRPFFGPDPLISQRTDRILLYGKYYSYPVKIHELLAGVPMGLALRILWDYLHANSTLRFHPPAKHTSFEEWGFYPQLDGLSTYHLAREQGMRGVYADWFVWDGERVHEMGATDVA